MKHLFTAFATVLLIVAVASFGDEEKPPTLTLVWPDGTKYIGGVVDGKRNGEGTIYWTDGTKFIGRFKNDLRSGPGSMVLPDGTVHSGYFENDKLIDLPAGPTSHDRQQSMNSRANTQQAAIKRQARAHVSQWPASNRQERQARRRREATNRLRLSKLRLKLPSVCRSRC